MSSYSSLSSSSCLIEIKQHLYQIYPQMPRYAADKQQSQIICIYDHIMLRFSGHYGHVPQYYIKSPLSALLLGDDNCYYDNSSKLSICSNQNIIICISSNSTNKIRLNNYSSTLYGQIQIPINIQQWKYKHTQLSDLHNQQNIKNQQYNLIMIIFKTFVHINQIKQFKNGYDLLVYKDFIQDQFIYSKQSYIYALYTAIHTAVMKAKTLEQKTLNIAYMKIAESTTNSNMNNMSNNSNNSNNSRIKPIPYILNGEYNKLTLISNEQNKAKYLPFPQNYSLIMANSMTPLPKKLIKGKRFNLRQCQIQIGLQLIMSQVGINKQIKTISNFYIYYNNNKIQMI